MSANIYLSSFTSNSKTPGSAFVADSHHASSETNILRLEEIHTHQDNYGRNAKIDEADDTDDDSTTNNEKAVVSGKMIADALSNYGRSPDGLLRVFLDVKLIGRNLVDINKLAYYVYLQKIILSHNKIIDLSPISFMPHLVYLDVSHNELTELLDFKPPTNLKFANFSYNKIKTFKDLTEFNTLSTLILDYNQISDIEGLENVHHLAELRMAHNNIAKIQNLDNLHLKLLDISYNKIKKIENIETLNWLQHFFLANNFIRSLKGLQNHEMLEIVDLEDNQIIDFTEIKYLKGLDSLRDLNLRGNPIQSLLDYRLSMLYRIPWLTSLDHKKALETEKVAAKNIFAPKIECVAGSNFVSHYMYSFAQSRKLHDSTESQLHKPYPIIVFVGPSGSQKKDLMLKLMDEFPLNVSYCQPLTTKPFSASEMDSKQYIAISNEKFEKQRKLGRFLQTCEIFGQRYGISRSSIEKIAKRNLICLIHSNLQGALTIRCSHFKPHYLLLIPFSRKEHENRLRNTTRFSDGQISQILASREEYITFNSEAPGFFDYVVNTDEKNNLTAYEQVRSVVINIIEKEKNPPIVSSRISKHDITTNGVSTHYFSHRTISESTATNSTPISYFEPTRYHFDDVPDGQALQEQEAPRPGTRGDYSIAHEKMKQMGFKPQSAPLHFESDDSTVFSEYIHKRPISVPETVSDNGINSSIQLGNTASANNFISKKQDQDQLEVQGDEEEMNFIVDQFNGEMKIWAEVIVDHEFEKISTNGEVII